MMGRLGYLFNGELFITGREKQEIIINGVNYFAHELETTIEELEGVNVSYTAAFAFFDSKSRN
jgi:microcystin synthetase protein McyG